MVKEFDWIDTERLVCCSSGNDLDIMKRHCHSYNYTCWNPVGNLVVGSAVHLSDYYGAKMMLVEEE